MENALFKESILIIKNEFEKMITGYADSWHELNKYRGMEFVDNEGNPINVEEFETVNLLLHDIQIKFHDMWPLMDFILSKSTFCQNMATEYDKLMQHLIENGAESHDLSQSN